MKATLVLPGGPKVPQLDKARRYGVTRIYWCANDTQLDSSLMDAVRSNGFEVGVMRDPSWTNADPSQLAQQLSDDLVRWASPSFFVNGQPPKQCAVLADIETHSAEYIVQFLTAWRKLRNARETAWTMEPNQGGWFSSDLVSRINADPNLRVLPQLYFGDMAPAVESQVALDIAARGINVARIECFYGVKNNVSAWQGILFDLINLP